MIAPRKIARGVFAPILMLDNEVEYTVVIDYFYVVAQQSASIFADATVLFFVF